MTTECPLRIVFIKVGILRIRFQGSYHRQDTDIGTIVRRYWNVSSYCLLFPRNKYRNEIFWDCFSFLHIEALELLILYWHGTALYTVAVLRCATLCCTVLHCTVLCCIVQYCAALYSTVLLLCLTVLWCGPL